VVRTAQTAAVLKAHQKLREAERDNTGVEAAHKVEFMAERGTGRFLRWNKNRLHSKPYRAVRQAQSRLQTEQTRLAWQTALRDHPELQRKNALSKWYQKQKIKRKYAQAAREAQKTAQQTQNVLTTTGKIVRAVAQTVSAHRTALVFIALLALVIMLFSTGLSSCTAMLSGLQSTYISAAYLANEQDICNSDLYYTELETDLQIDINDTETNHPGYDEYRYNIGEISHNPYVLMGYLSAGSLTDYAGLAELHGLLTAHGWTAATAVCVLVFTMFHFPCGTTCFTIWKETKSVKWTALAILLPTAVGIVLCILIHLACVALL